MNNGSPHEPSLDPDHDSDESDEEPGASPCAPTQRGRGRGTKRPQSPQPRPHHRLEPWRTENDPDTGPKITRFTPRRTPGAQLDPHAKYTPLDLFRLYFSPATAQTLCRNTNKHAAQNKEQGKKYTWADVGVEELYKFIGLLLYTTLVKLPSIHDYWKLNQIISVPFPATVMVRDRFRTLLWNIHPSDPEEDAKNEEKKGTPEYDQLFRIKPLLDDLCSACQAHYHPRRELAVGERMVVTKAPSGIKLFVLADSSNGYMVNFNIILGKTQTQSHAVHEVAYDAVVNLVNPSYLGSGYHVYMDSFYSSPQLFLHLKSVKLEACGIYRSNRKGCPNGRENALTAESARGTVRWIREGPLLFLKWMDTRELSVCSTIHPALSGEVAKRTEKEMDGNGAAKNACPPSVMAYNKHMGGVDLSNQLIQYYSTQRRTSQWYRTLFLHLVDIATTNAYLLHCDISASNQAKPLSHKDFQMELVSELCGAEHTGAPAKRQTDHVPAAIAVVTDVSQRASQGRRSCQRCWQVDRKRISTPWKCQSCDAALCLIPDRNCFAEWHSWDAPI